MSKVKRMPSFNWPKGWFSRQVPYSPKEYEIRFDSRYVLTVREEIALQTFQWLQKEFPTGFKIVKEVVEPEWE